MTPYEEYIFKANMYLGRIDIALEAMENIGQVSIHQAQIIEMGIQGSSLAAQAHIAMAREIRESGGETQS